MCQGKLVYSLTDSHRFHGDRRPAQDGSEASAQRPTAPCSTIRSTYQISTSIHWNRRSCGSWPASSVRLVGGLFYYKGSARASSPAAGRAGTQRVARRSTTTRRRGRSTANVVYHPIESELNLTGGLRHSDDQKSVDFSNRPHRRHAAGPDDLHCRRRPSTIFDIRWKR